MADFDYAPRQDFLTRLDALGIKDFYPDIGNHVLAQSLKWQGAWQEGKTPNMLEKSLLIGVMMRRAPSTTGGSCNAAACNATR
jgi:hypothetical protein